MGETVNLNLKIDEDRKQEWTEFIEEHPDINTYTSLIKKAVSRHIGQYHADDDEDTLDEELILDRFSDIESRLQDTHNTVQVIQDHQDEYRITEDDIQYAALLANEEFWEGVDISTVSAEPTDREEWRRGD
jgi:H2-forming N5,N10-methylenetetrahydromethanopterin dehydrogenase-like enzyme